MSCAKCSSDILVPMSGSFIKMCADCLHENPWPLKENQQPLSTSCRDRRKPRDKKIINFNCDSVLLAHRPVQH